MRKYLLLFLLLGVVCAVLSGCHGTMGLEPFETPEDFNEEETIELTFWAKNDTNKTQTNIYEKAIRSFEALYPNIKVTLRLYTDYGKIYNDVITNISTGTTPNVCITYPDHIATYLTGKNTVVPLKELAENEKYGLSGSEVRFETVGENGIVPKYYNECIVSGSQYALPFMRSTEACYINKTYVEALGYTLPDVLTWDFIFEVADKAAEKNEDGIFAVNGQKVMIPFIYKSTDNMMIQYLQQSGAGYLDPDGTVRLFNETAKELLYTVSKHTKTGAFSTFKISSYPANFLNAGQCVFAVDSTAGSTWMGSEAPLSDIAPEKLVKFEIAVRPVPQVDAEKPQMISQGPSICIFNKRNPQEVLASWLFAQFLLTNDVQIAYAETEGYVPVTVPAQTSTEYTEYLNSEPDGELHYAVKLEATRLLLKNIDNTFVTSVKNGSASLRDAAGSLIESVTKSTRRSETVDEAYMEKLVSDVTALYRLNETDRKAVGKREFGPLPAASVTLLLTLCIVWLTIIVYIVCYKIIKSRKKNKKIHN